MQRPVDMVCFAPQDWQLPRVQKPGDIIRLHRVKVRPQRSRCWARRAKSQTVQGCAVCLPPALGCPYAGKHAETHHGAGGRPCAGANVQRQAAVHGQAGPLGGPALCILPLRLQPHGACRAPAACTAPCCALPAGVPSFALHDSQQGSTISPALLPPCPIPPPPTCCPSPTLSAATPATGWQQPLPDLLPALPLG